MPFLAPNRTLVVGADIGGTFGIKDHSYHLSVDDMLTGIFLSLSGGDIEIGVIQHPIVFESGASTTLFIPGTTSFAPINLTRGFANYHELWTWWWLAANGHMVDARRSGTIEMKRTARAEDISDGLATGIGEWFTRLRWNFYDAWPSKLSSFGSLASQGTAEKSTMARVSVTLVAEYIEYEEVS